MHFVCLFVRFLHSTTAESLTNHNEAELQRRCQERQHEIDQMQQVLETKIQLLQEVGLVSSWASTARTRSSLTNPDCFCVCVLQEAQLARSEAERMASLAGSHSHTSLISLDAAMEDISEDDRAPSILSSSNTNKDRCRALSSHCLISGTVHSWRSEWHPWKWSRKQELPNAVRTWGVPLNH